MRKVKLLFLLLCICFVSGLVAVPFGTLGNINVPDGYIMPANKIQVNFGSYLRDESTDANTGYEYIYVIQAKYGLFERAELGLVYTGDEIFFANFKFKLIEESMEYPGICFGVDNLFSKVGTDSQAQKHENEDWFYVTDKTSYERNSFYVTASKSWAFRDVALVGDLQAYLTIGMGVNRFEGQSDLAEDFNGLFGSLELRPNDYFSLFTEQSGHAINVGTRYSWDNFDFQYSLLEIEELVKENQNNLKMALNINYNINRWASKKTTKKASFSKNNESIQTETQSFNNTNTGSGASLLERIRALRAEQKKKQKQNDLDSLIDELDEIEE